MKIGILEIMPKGHFTLVYSICNIFASQETNEIHIFTHALGASSIQSLKNTKTPSVSIHSQQLESLEHFLDTIKSYHLDRLYVTTLEKHYKTFYFTDFGCPVHLFIHNIDEWLHATPFYRIYHLINEFVFSLRYFYTIKRMILYPQWRKKILIKILNTNGKAVVLNSHLKSELMRHIDKNKIDVIPFSIYDRHIGDRSIHNKKIRICIPGLLSASRRDYNSVFTIIENNLKLFKDTIELDLLGGVTSFQQDDDIIKKAEKLKGKGMAVYYTRASFIPMEEYDKRLSYADILLGNIKLKVNKYSSYGKTKETGVIFAMIHAAKPGLMYDGYPIPLELRSSTIMFSSYDELAEIIITFIKDRNKLSLLKENAKTNSLEYEPSRIFRLLR